MKGYLCEECILEKDNLYWENVKVCLREKDADKWTRENNAQNRIYVEIEVQKSEENQEH